MAEENSNEQNNQNQDNNQNSTSSKQVVIGCDTNNGNDSKYQDAVEQALIQAGYQIAEKLPIAPGPFGNYSYTEAAKGKIGVYLMAGSLVSFLDAANSNFDYTVVGIRGDASRSFKTQNDFNLDLCFNASTMKLIPFKPT